MPGGRRRGKIEEERSFRDEMTRLTARIDELEAMLGRPRVEASTMTDSVQVGGSNFRFFFRV